MCEQGHEMTDSDKAEFITCVCSNANLQANDIFLINSLLVNMAHSLSYVWGFVRVSFGNS